MSLGHFEGHSGEFQGVSDGTRRFRWRHKGVPRFSDLPGGPRAFKCVTGSSRKASGGLRGALRGLRRSQGCFRGADWHFRRSQRYQEHPKGGRSQGVSGDSKELEGIPGVSGHI